jgi:hypothetical protein
VRSIPRGSGLTASTRGLSHVAPSALGKREHMGIVPRLHKVLAIKAAREGRSLNAYVAEKLWM